MAKSIRDENEEAILQGVGNRIRWVRELAGVSQSELARLYNTDQSKWSKYESGQRKPDPVDMISFCARFDVTMDYIYRGRLAGCNHELALRLAAEHPELVLNRLNKG
jgi:transcriptional regulator with XRE-family HTH domain